MKAGRIVLLIFGVLFVITSFGLLIGGGVLLTLENSFKDPQGFYSTQKIEVNAKSAAIVTGPAEINIDTLCVRPHNLATLKIEAVNVSPDKAVFIGIARTSAINNYLDGISYSEAREFSTHQDTLLFHTYQGTATAPAPASQSFWVASASGSGNQTLEWDITSGRYSVVLMNADGTSPIDADVSLGVKVPGVVNAVGVGLLVSGIILFLGGGVMIFFGARGW
jgi:hypothetical protein